MKRQVAEIHNLRACLQQHNQFIIKICMYIKKENEEEDDRATHMYIGSMVAPHL